MSIKYSQNKNFCSLTLPTLHKFLSFFKFLRYLQIDEKRTLIIKENNVFNTNIKTLLPFIRKYSGWLKPSEDIIKMLVKIRQKNIDIDDFEGSRTSGFVLMEQLLRFKDYTKDWGENMVKEIGELEDCDELKTEIPYYLTCHLSIASVERSFSFLSNILTPLNHKLKDENVKNKLIVFSNKGLNK